MDEEEYITADIPDEFKALRACLRCSLVKTFEQVKKSPMRPVFLPIILYFAAFALNFDSSTTRDAKIASLLTWRETRAE